ncbi:hypothetical protein IFM89_034639 [Coptis chinensis]|uniref:HECT-type E3 ubiquitin transferase n=1 Tax=Coptis chinensis TaxID=261450 RepID=A0A835HLZ2_9MAGN|nr:hypothetical protein IFM89_034639 [Coptis chinensis]
MTTTIRSNLPSRLRQLISGDGAVGPSLKLESEPPPTIKVFIDKVIKSPLNDIALPLSSFRWEYNKGNFHHWRPLFLHFDTYFKTYLSGRKDLLLSDDILDDDKFPKPNVLEILKVMKIILENCHNKSSFGGLEHFKFLLASTDPDILNATLETLSALVKINPSKLHVNGKLVGCGSINSSLLSLAQGWGSKEEGLGLYSCVVANEKSQVEGLSLFPYDLENECGKSQYRLGSTLYYEFRRATDQSGDDVNNLSTTCVVHIPDLHLRKEDDLSLLNQCVEQYNVPQEHRFSLLNRIRYARAFRSPRTGRLYSRICLLAFVVLVQSNDANDELASFFANEPEYTNELIRIVRSEEAIHGDIRTLAMLALGSQLAAYASSHDRARILSGSSIISAGGNRMILLNVLQKAVLSLSSSDKSSLPFVEALLQFYLLHVISSSSSGSAIRGSGMVPTLLPLLQDDNYKHMHLVCLAVKALQKLMDYSNAAVSLFKDLGGVELLSQRLQTEVNRVIGEAGPSDKSIMIGDLQRFDDDLLYSQKRLIRALLKALGSATYAPTNSARSHNSHDNSLPGSLSLIFRNVERFGGDIYFSAVTVMNEIIHKDPTCFSVLHELGLPDAFLSSITAGILPSSKAITCVPSGLGAICLNAKGLEAVNRTNALRFLVDIFTTRKYVLAMNEGVVPLANAVEELLRHVSTLRGTGVDIIIEIIEKLASLGDEQCSGLSEKVDGTNAMETDTEEGAKEGPSCLVNAMDSVSDGINSERFVQLCIFHAMVLVHRTMENSETCRLFVEKKGIDILMRLLLRPSIAQSSEGMSIALHSTVVFKGFTQHHSAPLAVAFCSFLGDHLKKALTGFSSASGSFLLAPKTAPDKSIFSSLFIVEFLLFLAASKENRWVTALLTEFGNKSKEVLEDIGRLHREVLWQISLLDDTKHDKEDGVTGPATESERPEASSNETEEQRFNSFRQFLDPLLRRRTSGWSVESQFFDLINLYRDLGRATGVQQRLGMDGHSNLRLGSSHQLLRSGSDAGGSVSKLEGDKERSYYSSCCDMIRSLSFHINHLFLELGKVMLLPTRRRDDSLNVSPTSKIVVSTFASIALDHLSFEGHVDPSKSELSISTKCRYLGKVIDFVDSIMLDKPDSCNPILVNYFYGHGVIQEVLTTFVATSQLLFAVNRAPSSPMETDDCNSKQSEKEETDNSWIYGPLASYGKLMDHLVTSSFVLSPFTKHLLSQPLANGNVPFPRDAETFVKEGEMVQLPPVDELLSTCMQLLHVKEPLAFPVRDFLVMMCSQNDGQDRSKVISFIIEHVKLCGSVSSDSGNITMLSALFHVLALVLHKDSVAREVAIKSGLITIASDLLSQWDPSSLNGDKQVPKWVTAAFLALDRLLQVDPKLNSELSDQLKKDDLTNLQSSVVIEEDKPKKLQSTLNPSLDIDLNEQKRLVEIACRCITNQLPSETMHVVLQLCATLTRTHSVAVNFLEAGGLPSLLSLPTKSLFSGFDNVASTIVRHILEDPQTLQLAMESEIRHSLISATNRHSNGRVTPRNFLINLASVVSRDAAVFMQAAKSVCQIEMVGERPCVVLLKDREKEKSKEKEKSPDKDKQQIADVKNGSSDVSVLAPGSGHGKVSDSNPKNVKIHRKPPPSFTSVIELLLDSVITFVPSSKDDCVVDEVFGSSSLADMDIDDAANKGKGKAVATLSEEGETNNQETSASLAKTVFILKLLTEILLTYSSSVHVLLRRDSEVANYRSLHLRGPPGTANGGIFYHILHKFLPYSGCSKKEKKVDGDWRQKLATRASQLLVASCVRSVEGRRRVFMEIGNVFNDFADTSGGFRPPNSSIHAFVDLLNDVLAARSPSGSYISAEASATFIDVGLVRSSTRTLQILDLDHADSAKVVTSLVKALELVTKEHVHSSDTSSAKGENSAKPPEQNQSERTETGEDRSQSLENAYRSNHDEVPTDHIEPFNTVQASGSSESVTDDMEHDRDLDGDDHEIDEDEFDEDMLDEDDDDDEDDEDGVILRLEEGINGINVFDHMDVFGRENNFQNDTLHVMPVEVFGSRRQGRSMSIYNLLGRTGENGATSQHPLLSEPSSALHPSHSRISENAGDAVISDRNLENASTRLDAIFRSLRNGRHGHRLNMWTEDSQQRTGSNPPSLPQGLEELLVSQLRRPELEKPSENDKSTVEPQAKVDANQLEESEPGVRLETLEVEIGSADGHDDGGERQGSMERLPLADLQPARMRRSNASLGNTMPASSRDASLQSVSEVSESAGPEAVRDGPTEEQQINSEVDSGSIDPAFLDALPEELRAEVLSTQHGQAAQPSNSQPQSAADIDPEFLAALPPDIRAEVLAQQQVQRLQQSQELEGQPVEMDTVSIIATFPSDLREEVLLTSSDAILANLTPALVAEANMLRERFAHRYHSRTLFGMYPRNRRGESSRRAEAVRGGGSIASRRSGGGKIVEADGTPLVDTEALKGMIRLLRVVQPLYRGPLQRLLLNLCAHQETRSSLVQILMEMLLLDTRKRNDLSSSVAEPSYRLYACQNNVIYSRPQFLDGVPPLVSRRILETLTYLARSHPSVAKLLLQSELPHSPIEEFQASDQRGKAIMLMEEDIVGKNEHKGGFAIILLLSLLNQPLYLRSIAHLEQLLNLLEVVIDNAENNSSLSAKSGASPTDQVSGPQSVSDAEMNSDTGGSSSGGDVKLCKTDELPKPSTTSGEKEFDTQAVLLGLPQGELRLLCSLLAREG